MKKKIFNFIGEMIIKYIFWRERKGGDNSVICIKRKNGAEQVIKVFSKQAYANIVYPALHNQKGGKECR